MSDRCETASAVLALYAEGELHDPGAVEHVRAHLLDCAACREALDSYDRLTRMLLAGEPACRAEGGDRWVDLEHERRVEGVLRRLDAAAGPPAAATAEGIGHGARVSDPPCVPIARRARPRLRLHLDDVTDSATTDRRLSRRRAGSRRSALAAAALLGVVSVWLALMLSRNAPGPDSQAPPGHLRRPSHLLASSGPGTRSPEPPSRESDSDLGWVRVDPAPAGGSGEPELLCAVGYTEAARSAMADLPSLEEAQIEWAVEVFINNSPAEDREDLSKSRYLLVPELDAARGGAPSRHQAGALRFRPGRIERRPASEGLAPRLVIGDSTVYRVYVYEGLRRLEPPDVVWAPVSWRPEVFEISPPRGVPRPLPAFTGSARGHALRPEPSLRF